MPWVCANCNANNSSSHATCDICGSDQRLSHEVTVPISIPKRGKPAIPTMIVEMSIDWLDLSTRTHNCLRRAGITTIDQLLHMKMAELKAIPNLGDRSLDELKGKVYHICLLAGYDPGVMWHSTATTATHTVDEKPVVSSSAEPDHRIDTKSGLIAAAVTSLICYLLLRYPIPSTDIPFIDYILRYLIPWFIPIVLATLMYGRIITLVSISWFLIWLQIIDLAEVPFEFVIRQSLTTAIMVLVTWYYTKRNCVSEVTADKLTLASIVGASIGIISMYIIRFTGGPASVEIIPELSVNAIIIIIAIRIWWWIMKRIYPNPEVIVMRHLTP